MKALTKWMLPPNHYNFEHSQRIKFLHYTLIIIVIGMGFLAIINRFAGAYLLSKILLINILILMGLFNLNQLGRYKLAGSLLLIMLYVVIAFNLVDGLGLHDPGILAFPAFILIAAYLFGKKATWIATGFSVLAIIFVRILFLLGKGNFLKHGLEHSQTIAITICLLYLMITFVILTIYTLWEKTLERVNETYEKTLQGWANTLEYRDLETQGHSNRVAEYIIQLAKTFNLSENEIENIKRGALLHDVGKLAIPDRILLKPGSLTFEEREVMQRHPIFAKIILEEISFLHPSLNIPLYHHENWDGTGYPFGLSGEEIPLEARMFAVIDNWDALLSDRPYRRAWPKEKVLDYLQKNAGAKFDPIVVETFLALKL